MPNRFPYAPVRTSFFVLSLLALPAPAFAGFQWIAPPDAPAAPVVIPAVPMAPVATTAPEVISPVIISGNAGSASTAPVISRAPAETLSVSPGTGSGVTINRVEPAVPTIGGSAELPAPATVSTLSVAPQAEIVRGFAKQVPLAVALRQILPAGYGFSVDPDVDMGVLISFQGGKTWRETLRDALDPAGLVMRENGQMVSIGRPPVVPMTDRIPAGDVPLVGAPRVISAAPGVAVSAPPVVETMPQSDLWTADRGDNLHKIIEAWTKRANVELNWLAEYDYPLQASFSYTGTFEDAVRNLLMGFEEAHPQPVAELHTNPGLGLRVLLVQTRGNSNGN